MLKKLWKQPFAVKFAACLAVYVVLAGIFSWVVGQDWRAEAKSTDAVSRAAMVGDMASGAELAQSFTAKADRLTALTVDVSRWDENGAFDAALLQGDEVLWSAHFAGAAIPADGAMSLDLPSGGIACRGAELTLRITSGGGVSFWWGDKYHVGKFDVAAELPGVLRLDGAEQPGMLVMRQLGEDELHAAQWVWPVAALLALIASAVAIHVHRCAVKGRPNRILDTARLLSRYSYLTRQLVSRDFKVKYKSSVLGVFWSFLNPLLMTVVYNFVFSTLFHSDIEHFVVYLMSGIIIFSYFSDSSNLGLLSIIGNANLINKVYVPKYIYPLTKIFSSAINMIISFVPLFIIMLFTGVPFTKSLLLLPLLVVFVVAFCAGVSLFLSAATVFFQDIRFLWSVVITVWNFLTPIFYPESIIPAQYLFLYRLNPLYQFCTFARTIILGGAAPSPLSFLWCLLACGIPLAVGILVFRKTQDQFALYL